MTSILFLTETIERKQFRFNYLRNKNLFVNFVLRFSNLYQVLNIWKQKHHPQSLFISEITDCQRRD